MNIMQNGRKIGASHTTFLKRKNGYILKETLYMRINNADTLTRLEVEISGITYDHLHLHGGRQSLNGNLLIINKESLPDVSTDYGINGLNEPQRNFLEPSPFIESDHPTIRNLVKKIVEADETPLKKWSFGGILFMMVCAGYIGAVIVIEAGPVYNLFMAGIKETGLSAFEWIWIIGSFAITFLIYILAIVLPMRFGERKLSKLLI